MDPVTPVTLTRTSTATAERLWAVVTDMVRHAKYVPFTTIHPQDADPHLGWEVLARTGFGPLGFNDTMLVTGWEPPPAWPARMRLVKTGRLLDGWAEIVIEPRAEGGSRLTWHEQIEPRPTPLRFVARLGARVAGGDRATKAMLARLIDGLLAEAEESR